MKQRLHPLINIAAIAAVVLPVAQLIMPLQAFAHQVQTDYILKDSANRFTNPQAPGQTSARTGSSIELRSEFTNGEPLKGANVVIYAPNQPGRIWAKGVTDSEGRYDFAPDTAIQGDWEVQITRAGHADILTVPVSANGIEADLVSQNSEQDLHYAQTSPWAIAGSVAVAAACVGFVCMNGKRKVEQSS